MKEILLTITFLTIYNCSFSQYLKNIDYKNIEKCKCINESRSSYDKEWDVLDSLLSIRVLEFIKTPFILDSFYLSFHEVNENPYVIDTIQMTRKSKNFNNETTKLGCNLTLRSLKLYGGTITYTISVISYNNKILFKELKVDGLESGIKYYKQIVFPAFEKKIQCRVDGIIWRDKDINNIKFVNNQNQMIEFLYNNENHSSYFFDPLNTYLYTYCSKPFFNCVLEQFISEYKKKGIPFLNRALKSPNPTTRIYAIETLQYLEKENNIILPKETKDIINYHLNQEIEITTQSGCSVYKTFYGDPDFNWNLISRTLNKKNSR